MAIPVQQRIKISQVALFLMMATRLKTSALSGGVELQRTSAGAMQNKGNSNK